MLVHRDNRVLRIVAGVACLVLGAWVLGRPFASLAVLVIGLAAVLMVLGVRELVGEERPWPWVTLLTAGGWFVSALVLLAIPAWGFRVLVVAVGIWLLMEGLSRVVRGLRGAADDRMTSVLYGAASMVLGVLALRWPDITLTVVALAVGVRVLWLGLSLVWGALRGMRPARPARGRLRRVGRAGLAALSLVLALGLAGVSYMLHATAPVPDAFYATPADVPDEPGQLLRAEPFTRAIPTGASAWRILYTTTRDEGVPALASGLVVTSDERPVGPRPVLAWAHGTTGVAEGCAPSLLGDPFEAGAMPALDEALAEGWVVVATDYVGLGTRGPHPYLIGQGEGRSVLDAIRAARQLDGLDLGHDTVVWGHSQGGHAALWTGVLASTYAPDAGVGGVAALAPASDLPAMVAGLDDVPVGALFASFVVAAYDATYPDVRARDLVRPGARIPVEEMAERCLAERSVLVSVVQNLLFEQSIFSGDPATGATGDRLSQNVPSGPIDVPVLVAQGQSDELITPTVQAAYVDDRCRTGGEVDYRTYPGMGHLELVAADSPLVPELLEWTRARFAGQPVTPAQASGC
ncbi:alpha/beta fold hydrolase [Nocardioides sp.]|uniref:alpha/beta fold hydrolase n=1 Tax=Nocardioides sp. TaxID=35761 RepID=UPI002ED41741